MKHTTTTTTTPTTTTTTPTTFADLLHAYNNNPTDPTTLTDLATAVTYSVLRKVIDPTRKHTTTDGTPTDKGHNPALLALRASLTRDRAYLARLDHATDGATRWGYDKDGNPSREIVDPDLDRAASVLIREALTGDGLDLLHDAMVAILDETEKQTARDPEQGVDLERPYTVRRLKKRVWIKEADSVNGWETVETTPIQEVYKAVRRAIQNSRAMQSDPRNGYLYLSTTTADPDSGETETIYRRLPRYADIGTDGQHTPAHYTDGQPVGLDGRPTHYSTDAVTVETLDRLVGEMNLTDREATILKFRMQGYGCKAIATRMGVTVNSCKGALYRLREKARTVGLDPDGVKADD